MTTAPTVESLLEALPKSRLVAVGRSFGVGLSEGWTKRQQVAALSRAGLRLGELLRTLGRDELKAACRAHGLDDSGRARPALAGRLAAAHGLEEEAPRARFAAEGSRRHTPRPGDVVQVRRRQYLVESAVEPPAPGQATRVRLVCLDDDDQGRPLEVLWELELGARVLQPEVHGLGEVARLDPPRHFAAYLHALGWNAVTATDPRLFQAPFRAGIRLFNHQLTPLEKALRLPRANLFIADDVGLGKTIEAGLVLQELILRQRVDFALVVCPAAICLQWRDEMARRFGLHFELYNRDFIARRRQERGFGVNPWGTHNRFVVSHSTLRRPEHRDPLLQHLGERARKSLLILDEAHAAAPASASKYAVDSAITRVIRDVAPRFENRLFLSATPHNGHSNSFSALLEILDPQRFTRGVPVANAERLRPVMVRRLKEDLKALGSGDFPDREVVQLDLVHEGGRWTSTARGESRDLGPGDGAELELARLLARYTELAAPRKGRGRLAFCHLQQRLLSSVEAFARTLEVHARSAGRRLEATSRSARTLEALPDEGADGDEYGLDEEARETLFGAEVEASSAGLGGLAGEAAGEAAAVLEELRALAERSRHAADAKALALVDWIRRHQCPAVKVGGAEGTAEERRWTDTRVIVFTEWGDTKRALARVLGAAFEGTERGDERILHFHGGMSDEGREEVQRAFNGPPEDHPVRVLLATDAAREGVNLQGRCADLFHFDVPWNPARMEQRNGRIDRTLQSAPVVRCHYFFYPQRAEDPVLRKLVEKVATIRRELGSLSAVVLDRLGAVMADGIGAATADALEAAEELDGRSATAREELESQRRQDRLREELDAAGELLNASREVMALAPALLRDAVDVGLELAGAEPLQPAEGPGQSAGAFTLPALPDSWQGTLDSLRPPRERGEPLWEWRGKAPRPVTFEPLEGLGEERVHLHLQHPFVQRILGRFLAQGFSAHDLSRVTVVRNPHDSLVRVIAFGRLSLFGPGAARLHDRLVSVAARWAESRGPGHLAPFADAADRKALEVLERLLAEGPALEDVPVSVRERLRASAAEDFAALWRHVREEADSLAHEADRLLAERGAEEAEALRRVLEEQRAAIEAQLEPAGQLRLEFSLAERAQQEQHEQDRLHMERRLQAIGREIATEPAEIEGLYRVLLSRLEPVGLVYLWPETRG